MDAIDASLGTRRPLPCEQCGYDLRGLSAEGVCPECGHAIAQSLRNGLGHVEPADLAAIASGTHAVAWAVGLSPLTIIGCFLIIAQEGHIAAAWPTGLVFLLVLYLHVSGGIALHRGGLGLIANVPPIRWGAELPAGLGLLMLAFGCFILPLVEPTDAMLGGSGIAFGLLTIGCGRFIPFYNLCRRIHQGLSRRTRPQGSSMGGASALGWLKLFADGGLTGCVSAIIVMGPFRLEPVVFFAYGALLMLPVWAVIWLITIIAHVRFALHARRALQRYTA
jgi:hypothetical protein